MEFMIDGDTQVKGKVNADSQAKVGVRLRGWQECCRPCGRDPNFGNKRSLKGRTRDSRADLRQS